MFGPLVIIAKDQHRSHTLRATSYWMPSQLSPWQCVGLRHQVAIVATVCCSAVQEPGKRGGPRAHNTQHGSTGPASGLKEPRVVQEGISWVQSHSLLGTGCVERTSSAQARARTGREFASSKDDMKARVLANKPSSSNKQELALKHGGAMTCINSLKVAMAGTPANQARRPWDRDLAAPWN